MDLRSIIKGDAFDRSYEALMRKMRSAGITVSTVSTNSQSPAELSTMQNIARWGGGRYYRADDQTKIPKIVVREAKTVARSGIVTGRF